MEFAEQELSSQTVFKGHIVEVEVQEVLTPEGNRTHREIVHHVPGIAILALTDDGKMLLEQQWRTPVGKVTLEIPAGKLDERDQANAVHAAKRELNEETRYQAKNLRKISSFYTSIGFMDEYLTLYLATGLTRVSHELPQDQDEQIVLKEVTLTEALAMIDRGEIEDAKTIMAIYYWQGMNHRG